MPEQQVEEAGEEASPEQREPVCILDAVICVHFVGANLHALLVEVLRKADLVLLVPQEVCDEVVGKDRKYPGIRLRWTRLAASRHVRVLPALQAESAPPRVVEVFEDVRGRQFEDALRERRDLGEAVVVAHGVHYQDLGHEVLVAIDDGAGQAIAAGRDLQVITMEDVLEMAVEFSMFPTEGQLKKAYEKLQGFGEGLPPYATTGLSSRFRKWRSRKENE
ncbi:hypothetical protein [Streptomyces sp. HM190]|uniref:hypothetical protein n=1 Tax=Streptomyces sp. HM190 TaxID=2695266 RepID=UPI00135BA0F7|nr:hypothetical protein [Streptomyces sp. HM190]